MAVAAITPARRNRARDAILALVRRRPGISISEIARELSAVDDPEVLMIALADTDLRVTEVQPAKSQDVWGPEPSHAELQLAQASAHRATTTALEGALAGALSREEVASRIGVTTPQAVSERRKAGKLVGLRRGREWRFPAWQFADDGTVPALSELIDAYPGTPLALSVWAVTPSPDLDGNTPARELTRRGGAERVLEIAQALSAAAW